MVLYSYCLPCGSVFSVVTSVFVFFAGVVFTPVRIKGATARLELLSFEELLFVGFVEFDFEDIYCCFTSFGTSLLELSSSLLSVVSFADCFGVAVCASLSLVNLNGAFEVEFVVDALFLLDTAIVGCGMWAVSVLWLFNKVPTSVA